MSQAIKNFLAQRIHSVLSEKEYLSLLKVKGVSRRKIIDQALDLDIRWYAQCDSDGIDTYGYDLARVVMNHRITKRAAIKLKGLLTDGKAISELERSVHYEHNPPVKVIREKLLDFTRNKSISIKDVKKLLDTKYEVIILSNDENLVLNRANGTFSLDGKPKVACGYSVKGSWKERLEKIDAKFASAQERKSLVRMLEQRKSAKKK